jgi:hypothetical protein
MRFDCNDHLQGDFATKKNVAITGSFIKNPDI